MCQLENGQPSHALSKLAVCIIDAVNPSWTLLNLVISLIKEIVSGSAGPWGKYSLYLACWRLL